MKKIFARKKIYSNNRFKTDDNFRIICEIRSRIQQAWRGTKKSTSTKNILSIIKDAYRKWIEFQMIPGTNWSNLEIIQVKPICMFDLNEDEQLKDASNWKKGNIFNHF